MVSATIAAIESLIKTGVPIFISKSIDQLYEAILDICELNIEAAPKNDNNM